MKSLRAFRYWHEAALACLLVAFVAWAGWLSPVFIKYGTQKELASHVWEIALLALPMTLIIVTGGIDLSAGSMVALSVVVLGLSQRAGVPLWGAVVLALGTGTTAGALNGLCVTRLKVHPLIVTLATLAAYRGIAEGISLGQPMSGFPDRFAVVARGDVLGMPFPFLLVVVLAVAAAICLGAMPLGRSLYAMGHNETASRCSGVPVDRIKLLLYTLSGAAAGIAAVMLASRRNTAKADMAMGMELDVITAVVLGGTSIYGGRGTIAGTVLGVLLIHELREFIGWQWHRDEITLVVVGCVLVVAVLANRLFMHRNQS